MTTPTGRRLRDDDEITATGELVQQYDLDDMVEVDVAELGESLDDSPGF